MSTAIATPARYIPTGSTEITSPDGGCVIYTSESANGALYAIAYQGKSAKHVWYNRFRTEDQRQRQIADTLASWAAHLNAKTARAEARKSFDHKLQVGEILHGSWGYEQTNCEFWQVVEVKGATVKIQPIGTVTAPTRTEGYMSEMLLPRPDQFCGEAITRRPTPGYKGEANVKLNDRCWLTPWDGAPKRCSWYA